MMSLGSVLLVTHSIVLCAGWGAIAADLRLQAHQMLRVSAGQSARPAVRTTSVVGPKVRHRTNVYLNNRLEQDHRGFKGRIRCMWGFKEHDAAGRFCREYDELRVSSAADPVTTNTFSPPRSHRDWHYATA
jgi:transposase-like protein